MSMELIRIPLKASEAMGVHRNTLYHLLKKHGLDPADYR